MWPLADQLRAAVTTRSVIDPAIGIIVATRQVDPDATFAILRRHSHDSNVRVAVIADQLIQ